METAYFHSRSPQASPAPGGVLRWSLYLGDAGEILGVLQSTIPAQIKYLDEMVARGGPVRRLTQAEYEAELGKSKGRSVVRDREALTPAGVRGGAPSQPAPAASPAGTEPAPATSLAKDPEPVVKRRDVRRVQDEDSR